MPHLTPSALASYPSAKKDVVMNFGLPRRLNRVQYILGLLLSLVAVALLLRSGFKAYVSGQFGTRLWLPIYLATALWVLRWPCLDAPRLRSMGWSPWLVLLKIIPVVDVVLQFLLLLIPPRDLDLNAIATEKAEDEEPFFSKSRVVGWSMSFLVLLALGYGYWFAWQQMPKEIDSAPKANQPEIPVMMGEPEEVQSIFFKNPTKSSAVVNSNSVMVGDHIGAWRVTAIGTNTVTFKNDTGQIKILQLKASASKP